MSEPAKSNGSYESDAFKAFEELIARMAEARGLDPELARSVLKHLIADIGGKGLSDEDLEQLTGYKQGPIRRFLRILYEMRLVTYRRGRHPETRATRYYWSIDVDNVNIMIYQLKREVLARLKRRLEYEKNNRFYMCPYHRDRYTFEEAFELDFTCPKCGSILEEVDNSDIVEALEERIRRLEEEIKRDEEVLFSH